MVERIKSSKIHKKIHHVKFNNFEHYSIKPQLFLIKFEIIDF